MLEKIAEPAGEYNPAAFSDVEDDESSIDFVALLQTLWWRRKSIFAIILGTVVLAAIVAFLLPVEYTSTASFIPPNLGNSSSMAASVGNQLAALGAGDLMGGLRNPAELYAGILQSRSIAGDLVKNFNLMKIYDVRKESSAEKKLASNTSVAVETKSSIVSVSVTAKSPELAHSLAAAYMDALRETNGRLALGQSSQRRLFFEQQLAREKDNLENAEVELKKTEEQSGLIAPSGQTEAEIRIIADTQAQIAARSVELAALRQSATDQNPEVIRLESEIGNLEGQLATLQKGHGRASGLTIPTSKVPQVQLDYVRKEREVKYHEALFEILSRQYEAARLDEARDAPVLQVLDPASYPDTKSSPRRGLIMLGGLLLGIIAGCVWALIGDRLMALRDATLTTQSA